MTLEFLISAFIFFIWFWLSLHPGSRLGFAITGGDLIRSFRHLDMKELQTKERLRTAGQKSLSFWMLLFVVGTAAGVSSGNYTLHDAIHGFLGGAVSGLALAYALLHWSTRRGGWYGEA